MIVFRHCDRRYPFLWEDETQPAARWHGPGDGPAQYFADTPTGAWAEFLRHEEIRDPLELAGVRRALWAIDIPALPRSEPQLPEEILKGDPKTYPHCQREAARLRSEENTDGLRAPSAALKPSGATGWVVDGGLQPGRTREGLVYVLFGARPELHGWRVVSDGSPPLEVLERVNHFSDVED